MQKGMFFCFFLKALASVPILMTALYELFQYNKSGEDLT
jgi:hypothetical protein